MASLLKMRRTWVIAVAALGLLVYLLWEGPHPGGLDPERPYIIQFGRGSGWHGLDAFKICDDGTVRLHRLAGPEDTARGFWETATLKLRNESLREVLHAVEKNRLLGLKKAYHGNVVDGTQWVLWIKQGEKETAVYFNNNFPGEIVGFADTLDKVLAENGLEKAAWKRVGGPNQREHKRALWDSIK
jgi:hypothetical protein